jgi:acyl dehydratase
MRIVSVDAAKALIGEELGVSDWLLVDQARINAFADVTGDHQFIHVDPERARQTPFGGTIAHGFLTLSLIGGMMPDGSLLIEGATMGVNYGFDKVRFLAPVPSGRRIRARHKLLGVEEKPGGVLIRLEVAIEIEGESKPAVIAEWLGLHYRGG